MDKYALSHIVYAHIPEVRKRTVADLSTARAFADPTCRTAAKDLGCNFLFSRLHVKGHLRCGDLRAKSTLSFGLIDVMNKLCLPPGITRLIFSKAIFTAATPDILAYEDDKYCYYPEEHHSLGSHLLSVAGVT